MKQSGCHVQSFFDIYKAINFHRGSNFTCSTCGKKLHIKWKRSTSPVFKTISCIMWSIPATILIVGTGLGYISALHAIGYITLFHILAMVGVIYCGRGVIKKGKKKKD